jgi:hypothetical protein
MKNKFIILLMSILMLQTAVYAYGNNFSCNYGKQGACLDSGDKVCSSYSKCVKDDAVCFDSYTCGYQGFVCKSKFQDLADGYDELVRKYNNLIRKQNDQMSCMSGATTMEDVQNCLLY